MKRRINPGRQTFRIPSRTNSIRPSDQLRRLLQPSSPWAPLCHSSVSASSRSRSSTVIPPSLRKHRTTQGDMVARICALHRALIPRRFDHSSNHSHSRYPRSASVTPRCHSNKPATVQANYTASKDPHDTVDHTREDNPSELSAVFHNSDHNYTSISHFVPE